MQPSYTETVHPRQADWSGAAKQPEPMDSDTEPKGVREVEGSQSLAKERTRTKERRKYEKIRTKEKRRRNGEKVISVGRGN